MTPVASASPPRGRQMNWGLLLAAGALLAAAVLILFAFRDILVPFIVALLLAYLLEPVLNLLERLGASRGLALLFLIVMLVLAGWLAMKYAVPAIGSEFVNLKAKLPEILHQAQLRLAAAEEAFRNMMGAGGGNGSPPDYTGLVNTVLAAVPVGGFFSALATLLLIPVITFFVLRDGSRLRKALVAALPNRHFELGVTILHEMDRSIGRYIRGQLLDALCVGILSSIGLWALGVKYYLLIGAFAGLTNMVPYLGPVMGAIPALLVIFATSADPMMGSLWVILLFLAVQALDNAVISPVVVGTSVSLHPLVVIFVILVGAQVMGLLGMLIAVPVTALLKVVGGIVRNRLLAPQPA